MLNLLLFISVIRISRTLLYTVVKICIGLAPTVLLNRPKVSLYFSPSIYLFVFQSLSLSVFLCFCLIVFLLSVFLSFCRSVFLSFCLSVFLSFSTKSQHIIAVSNQLNCFITPTYKCNKKLGSMSISALRFKCG